MLQVFAQQDPFRGSEPSASFMQNHRYSDFSSNTEAPFRGWHYSISLQFMVVFVSAAIYTHSTQWMSDLLCMRTIKGDAITSNPVSEFIVLVEARWSYQFTAFVLCICREFNTSVAYWYWRALQFRCLGRGRRGYLQMRSMGSDVAYGCSSILTVPSRVVQSLTLALILREQDWSAVGWALTVFWGHASSLGLFTANVFGGNCAGGRCITCIADRPCYSTVLPEQIDSQDVAWTDNRWEMWPCDRVGMN